MDYLNSHIKEACKNYITQDVNPEYAIMLNGPWGCGKTFFITELMNEPWFKSSKDNVIIKISLYGVSEKTDIEQNILNSYIKKNGNQKENVDSNDLPGWMKVIGVGTKAFVEGKFNIDTKAMMPYILQDCIKKIDAIVIDDLERASMPIHEIMGYLYNYILEQDIRVIFIGNEDEIKSEDDIYFRTKEKVIGETYTLLPEVQNAVSTFLSPSRKISLGITGDRAKDTCIKVIDRLEILNLRTVWQGLVRVQPLLKAVINSDAFNSIEFPISEYKDTDKTKEDYLSEILELYLVLYMQMAEGSVARSKRKNGVRLEFDKNEVSDVIGVYKNERCSLKALKAKEDFEGQSKNGSNGLEGRILAKTLRRQHMGFIALVSSKKDSYKLWSDFLFESKIDRKFLNSVIEEDGDWFTPKKKVKSNLYKLMSNGLNMNQQDFEACYFSMVDELKQGKYSTIGELMQAYSLCLTYKEFDVVEYKENEIFEIFEEVLKVTDIKINYEERHWSIYDRGSLGYAYSSNMRTGEGKAFADKLRDFEFSKGYEIAKIDFLTEFDTVESTTEFSHWLNLLFINNSGRNYNLYFEKPVLSWIGSTKLFEKLLRFSYDAQMDFIDVLKARYQLKYANGEFKEYFHEDYPVINELSDLYKEHLNSIGVGKIENYRLKLVYTRLMEIQVYCQSFITSEIEVSS